MRTRDGLRTASSRFQIAGLTLMFFLITLNAGRSLSLSPALLDHLHINQTDDCLPPAAMVLYTMIALYVVPPAPPVIPKPGVPPVRTPMPWDVYVSLVILIMVGWIADIIMVSRNSNESFSTLTSPSSPSPDLSCILGVLQKLPSYHPTMRRHDRQFLYAPVLAQFESLHGV